MIIRVGFEAAFDFAEPTAVVLMAYVHPARAATIRQLERLTVTPQAFVSEYYDTYGNLCGRTVVPAGRVTFRTSALVEDDGLPDVQVWNALQHQVQDLPNDVLHVPACPAAIARSIASSATSPGRLFGKLPAGWPLVQAVCDFVHSHIRFDYMQARANRTALEVYRERAGVCRDYMHLAITFCRCLNIPARYCTGYLGDIGVPPAAGSDGFQRLVRSLPGRTVVRLRRPQQHAAHRPHPDGPRPRRRRRGADHHLRREHAAVVSGLDGRSAAEAMAGRVKRIDMNESEATMGRCDRSRVINEADYFPASEGPLRTAQHKR